MDCQSDSHWKNHGVGNPQEPQSYTSKKQWSFLHAWKPEGWIRGVSGWLDVWCDEGTRRASLLASRSFKTCSGITTYQWPHLVLRTLLRLRMDGQVLLEILSNTINIYQLSSFQVFQEGFYMFLQTGHLRCCSSSSSFFPRQLPALLFLQLLLHVKDRFLHRLRGKIAWRKILKIQRFHRTICSTWKAIENHILLHLSIDFAESGVNNLKKLGPAYPGPAASTFAQGRLLVNLNPTWHLKQKTTPSNTLAISGKKHLKHTLLILTINFKQKNERCQWRLRPKSGQSFHPPTVGLWRPTEAAPSPRTAFPDVLADKPGSHHYARIFL